VNGIDNPVNYIQGAAVAKANGRRNGPIVERLPENHQPADVPDVRTAPSVAEAQAEVDAVESDALKEFRAHRERIKAGQAQRRDVATIALGSEPPEFGA
jgi:hypothetical protein